MKILLIEDNYSVARSFIDILENIYEDKSPVIVHFNNTKDTKSALFGEHSDFDVMLLDGELIWGDDGREIIKVLTDEQKAKTVTISGSREFVSDAKKMGISASVDKSFAGIMASEIDDYLKGEIDKVLQ